MGAGLCMCGGGWPIHVWQRLAHARVAAAGACLGGWLCSVAARSSNAHEKRQEAQTLNETNAEHKASGLSGPAAAATPQRWLTSSISLPVLPGPAQCTGAGGAGFGRVGLPSPLPPPRAASCG
eukprot:363565-Chlamydomonas_euryale.AAC.2